MPTLQPPLHLITASGHLGHVIRDWTRRSLGARTVEERDLPDGTLLLRTGADWTWMRRQIMLHNPGLDGLLEQVEVGTGV